MTDVKKDHSIGEGTGAGAGAIAGAVIGSAAGPIGTVVGAVVGAVGGAKAGGAIAEAVNPTAYTTNFKDTYQAAPYYNSERNWNDYEPAYKYSYDQYGAHSGKRFEDVENDLARGWDNTKGESRLAWNEARGAVKDGWHYIERAMPGDADGDGR
ncbi:MAG: glycine zipper domain-containing protein [Thermomonas sp.]